MKADPNIILFVDDDPYSSRTYIDELQDRGFQVTLASTADAAIEALQGTEFQLLITDLRMPSGTHFSDIETAGGQRTGLALARLARRKWPALPILFFTLSYDQDVRQWCSRRNNAAYLQKQHIQPSQLPSRAHRALRTANLHPNVFIVHGHDHKLLFELKDYVQNKLELGEPKVLVQQPSGTASLVDKFRSAADEIDIVLVLLTPDDLAHAKSSSTRKASRARQNVILELGYFLALARQSDITIVLLDGGVEDIPSDVDGLIAIDVRNGIDSAGERIRTELAEWL